MVFYNHYINEEAAMDVQLDSNGNHKEEASGVQLQTSL